MTASHSQAACTLCGGGLNAGATGGVCSECVEVLGSVIIEPDANGSAPQPAAAPARSGIFGDYEIVSELARGGMGVVYAARQISLKRRVALKMILSSFVRPDQIRRFQAEAENAATLDHPNIVPIYDSGTIDGVPYFSMKLIQGRGLNAELRRLVLDPRKGVSIMAAVARAVHFAHQRGILHRDLKPANVLIDIHGVPYVGDFGISKRVGTEDGMTREGAVMGTPYYMSPEQASGKSASLTVATDVYGLGAIFYEMLTLRAPFQDTREADILHSVKTEDPAQPRSLRAGVDRDLETICLKCLEKYPARRYQTAEDFARDLERWLNGEPIVARPHSLIERGVKWARRRPAVASSVALMLLMALLLGGFYWRSAELLRRAESAKLDERRNSAASAVQQGNTALASVRAALAKNQSADSVTLLIDAEDRFRVALVNQPENTAATDGLRETALLNFDASLRAKNFRQAREKLLLARSAALDTGEFERRQAQLIQLESERGERIRKRVKALLDDAASLTRSVTHENAVYELIAMKDPLTVTLLLENLNHERAECRMLALAALGWIGDAQTALHLLPLIEPKTQDGRDNPVGVQEAAIIAICLLAADDDVNTYYAIRQRISVQHPTILYYRVKPALQDLAARQAKRNSVSAGNLSTMPVSDLVDHATRLYDARAFTDALAAFDQLVALDPNNMAHLKLRGLLRRELLNPEGAVADFNIVMERIPNQSMNHIDRGLALLHMKEAAKALADFDRALALDPNSSATYGMRGLAHMDLGNMSAAIADYDKALKLNKDELLALGNRAAARARMKDFSGALADYDRALALSPNYREAVVGRACVRRDMRDTDGALADFDRALALDPGNTDFYYDHATLKMDKKDWKDALRDWDHFISHNPKVATAYYNRGITRDMLGDKTGSDKDYEKAIELDPNRADAMVNLGTNRARSGDFETALSLFNRAIATDPKKFEAWRFRAELHFRKGNLKQALIDLKTAESLLPPNAPKAKRDDVNFGIKAIEEALQKK